MLFFRKKNLSTFCYFELILAMLGETRMETQLYNQVEMDQRSKTTAVWHFKKNKAIFRQFLAIFAIFGTFFSLDDDVQQAYSNIFAFILLLLHAPLGY